MAPQEEKPLSGAGAGHGAWCLMSRGKVIVFQLPRKKKFLFYFKLEMNSSLLYEKECIN